MANLNSEIEVHIRKRVTWENLPPSVQQQLGNSPKEYDKSIVQFSIRNQLRYRGNLVRFIKREEKRYYEELVDYSRKNLMLFPYHLSDVVIKGLRITPFQYYIMVLENIMAQEKSYDSLPNFTAADCLRLLGIGRNQYIDLMNQTRSKHKFGGFSTGLFKKTYRDLLPVRPVSDLAILPWWMVQVGFITEDDVKALTKQEKAIIDKIIDNGSCQAGQLNHQDVRSLYLQGLVYFDIPIEDNDYMLIPPLEGFVMNRVTGDYFETLLYKLFVSIDEQTTVGDMANLLEIDLSLVKDAVSLYCRLGFAKKKHGDILDSDQMHGSWQDFIDATKKSVTIRCGSVISISSDEEDSLIKELNKALETDTESWEDNLDSRDESEGKETEEKSQGVSGVKKIGFLFDSTLTAYLMMGNLSPSLKNHAVTMFEVGKLCDESMDVFLSELRKISSLDAEGEAGVYFTAAVSLKDTILSLRNNPALKEFDLCLGLDLVRCESLQSLDQNTVSRLLQKNYSLLVSMAPLSHNLRALTSHQPPNLGPSLPELGTPWFKFFIYHKTGEGPPSLLLPRGWKMRSFPPPLQQSSTLLVTTWGHEPTVVPTAGALAMLQDALLHSPVLLQVFSTELEEKAETKNIAFPICDIDKDIKMVVDKLESVLDIVHNCGYISLVNLAKRPPRTREDQAVIVSSANVTNKVEPPTPETANPAFVDNKKRKEIMSRPDASSSPSPSTSPVMDSDTVQLLAEEVDSIDCPMAGGANWKEAAGDYSAGKAIENKMADKSADSKMTAPTDTSGSETVQLRSKSRPACLPLGGRENEPTIRPSVDRWLVLDVTYGVPLFDDDLNRAVMAGLLERGLAKPDTLASLAARSSHTAAQLMDFIRSCVDRFAVTIPAAEDDDCVPLPTRPVWFDGRQLCPLPPVLNINL